MCALMCLNLPRRSVSRVIVAHLHVAPLPKARAPALPSSQQGRKTRKQIERSMTKILVESTRLTNVVSDHPLPIIKNSPLLAGLRAIQRGSQELRDTCMIDGIPLQEDAVTVRILDALTKAAKVTKGILLRLEQEHVLSPRVTAAVDEAALNLSQITAALKKYETAMTAATDRRATMPSLLRRLKKKCRQ